MIVFPILSTLALAQAGVICLIGTNASAQVVVGAGAPRTPELWERSASVSLLSSAWPDPMAQWTVQAVVEPVGKPVVVRLPTFYGKAPGNVQPFLRFEVRGTGHGLAEGRTYRCLAALPEPSIRPPTPSVSCSWAGGES